MREIGVEYFDLFSMELLKESVAAGSTETITWRNI